MTRKEKILRMVQKLPDDVTYDQVMYHLDVMSAIERGLEQAERGEGMDHDDLIASLEEEDAKDQARLDARSLPEG
jgi:predicted transcriptional regulator